MASAATAPQPGEARAVAAVARAVFPARRAVVACAPVNDARALDRAAVGACAALACVAVVPAALAPLWDADVWWILRAGRDMLAESALPQRNRYGFTAPDSPWVMHEWGFGVVYALLARDGLAGLALARLGAVALAAAAASWRAFRDARGWVAALCVAVTLTVYGGRFESPRPVGVTYALACALAAVVFEPAFARRHVALVAALMVVWTNAHGSFPLGVLLAALGAMAPGGDRRARVGALALAALATLANPYGLALHALALRYALGEGGDAVAVVHARIVEWWPLWRDPLRVASAPELAGLVALVAVALASLRDARWRPRALAVLILAAMALRHSRHLGLAGLVGVPLLAGPVEALVARGAWAPRAVPRAVWALCVALPTTLGVALWGAAARSRTEGQWVDASAQDEAVRAMVAELPAGARVFAELPFTGYVVLLGAPRVSVYFDARNDCYPAAVLRRALDLNDGRVAPDEARRWLREAGATHAIARCRSSAARSLAACARVAARDGVCLFRVGE